MATAEALPSEDRAFSIILVSAPADQLGLSLSERQEALEAFRSTEGRAAMPMEDLCSTIES
jgi:UDP-N-acetylmuramyl pentapeptide synthase